MALGPNYQRLWASSAGSNLADGVFQVALPLLAVRLTRSPTLVAGVSLAARLPWLFMALVAGALADRLDRRRTMVGVNIVRAVVIAALAGAAAGDRATLPLVYAASLVLGVGETLFDTAAQSIMPALVPRDELSRANGRLFAVELVMNQFVGPPLGGLLVAVAVGAAFGVSAAAYLAAAVALALIAGSFRAERSGPPSSMRADIAEGVRFVWRHPVLRLLGVMLGVQNLALTAVFSVFVLYAVQPGPLGLSEAGYGLLVTAGAVGGLAGSWAAPAVERVLGRRGTLAACVAVGAAAMALPAFTVDVVVVAVCGAAVGLASVVWNVITVSLRQRITPDHLLGRMNSCYRLLGWGTMPVGALLGGVLGDLYGVPTVFVLAGALTTALLPAFARLPEAALRADGVS